MSKRKLTTLTLDEKANLILEIKKNPQLKKKDVAAKYGIPPSTLSTILKDKQKILSRHGSGADSSSKRAKTCAFPDVEAALLKWFETHRSKNIPLSGVLLKEKATDFARLLNVDGFNASTGWLDKFKARHKIVFRTLHGQAKDVSDETCENWRKSLPQLLQSYEPKDVFNLDETGLFFKCTPNKTMMFRNEICSGGKLSKERLTILVGANANGTEKLPLMVIGKTMKPRCLKNIKSLPVEYHANKKAWMTLNLFEMYIRKLDSKFFNQNRKVLLFVDNCTAHGDIANLSAIKLLFLPANTTAKLQPADQGIIKCLKHAYRKRLVRQCIEEVENGVEHKINVLDAMRLISRSWESDVSQTVIENCFKRCGFFGANDNEAKNDNWDPFEGVGDMDCEKDFMCIDDNIATSEPLSDEAIVNAVCGEPEGDEDEEEAEIPPPPTSKQAQDAVHILQQYLETTEGTDNTLFNCVQKLGDFVSANNLKKCKQQKITAFFK
jgi:hypothetical protein